MRFIGLDIGSSSIKGAVLDIDRGEVGEVIRAPSPESIGGLAPHRYELNPDDVVAATDDVLRRLAAAAPDCAGIVSCGQMGGVVLTDEKGRPLTNYLSWRDQRGLDPYPEGGTFYDVLKRRLGDDEFERLGRECKVGTFPTLLFWLAEHGTLPSRAIPLSIADYVWRRLANAEPVMSVTTAPGAIDIGERCWRRESLERLGLGGLRWPRLCEPYEPIGHWVIQGRQVPCYPSVGDHPCALAGVALAPGELSINVSTGSQVSTLADRWRPGEYQVRPYFDGQWLQTLTHLPAGRSLQALVELLGELAESQGTPLLDPWPTIHQAVERAAARFNRERPTPRNNASLEVDLAFFSGPMGESGAVRNMRLDNLNVGSLFLAAFENMADNYAECARRLAPNSDRNSHCDEGWSSIVLSGGIVQQSGVLREMLARRFASPMRLCSVTEETLTGLLRLAAVAAGRSQRLTESADHSP